MRRHPERRLDNAFSIKDISTVVKDDSALVLVFYKETNVKRTTIKKFKYFAD